MRLSTGRSIRPSAAWQWWTALPLYAQIVLGLAAGLATGVILGDRAAVLEVPAQVFMRLLGAIAPSLILVSVLHALMETQLEGRVGARLIWLLVLNTTVALVIGLSVANVVRPGLWVSEQPDEGVTTAGDAIDPVQVVLDNIPKSIAGPFGDEGKVIGVIILAVAFGVALRRVRDQPLANVRDLVRISRDVLLTILHWLIAFVPLAVFGIVASKVGQEGFSKLVALGAFVGAVLLGLALQAAYYLIRVRLGSWVRPTQLLRGTRDALVMAFSTASSTATMPVTYACLKEKVGLRERSASLGALVGANFNTDGTALYEAASALFVSQLVGQHLSIWEQFIVVLASMAASVGAAGIPQAGLVTMTLVFKAVNLPVEYIPMLLMVDWFLDRCRTAINVMGDCNVSCLLDGKTPPSAAGDESLSSGDSAQQ